MKFSSLQEHLKNALFVVSHVAGKNVNLPILKNIMIKAKKGEVSLVATDLEIGITNKIRGKVEQEGEFTVDSKIIYDYISLLPNKKVDIEVKNNELEIKCDTYKTKIKGQGAEEYPLIPNIEKKQGYKIKIKELKKALAQVVFATSGSETRLELTGVLFIFDKENLILVATDSYRLAEKKIKLKEKNENNEEKIIIPAKTVQELIRILSGLKENIDEDDLEISFSDSQVIFNFDSISLVSRLLDGQYPDYKQIIPTNFKTKAIINKQLFIKAVKMSSLFSKNEINDVNLDFPQGKNITIVSSTSNTNGENISEVKSKVSGDDNGVVINYRYLLDGLSNIDSEFISLEVLDANSPCLIRPENDDSYIYIIMPIKQ